MVRQASLVAAVAAGLWWATAFQRPLTSVELPQATAVVKLEFGLTHTQPRDWRGTIVVEGGQILSTWGWHFLKPDRVVGTNGFEFATRLFNDPKAAFRSQEIIPAPVLPNGVYVAVNAPETAVMAVSTTHGEFFFKLSDLKGSGRRAYIAGDVAAVYTPPSRAITRGEASHHDFPSAASRDDDLFVTWTTFQNEANAVYLGHRRGDSWLVHRASTNWGDYFGSAVATQGADNVVAAWSEYMQDRWRLVSRVWNVRTSRWSSEGYVAPLGRRQMFPRMATDLEGRAWIVWQEFADNNFDIFAASYDGVAWSAPLRISESAANDWNPAVATARDGTIYIAWDTYDAGNYDIRLRAIRNGQLQPVIKATEAPTYDAHPSIAVDPRNRVWIAWEESGVDWGKDFGVLGRTGTPLHASRTIRLARWDGGRLLEPVRSLAESLPAWLGSFHEFPQVTIGGNGVPYVFFRRYLYRQPMPEDALEIRMGSATSAVNPWHDTVRAIWNIWAAGFDGSRWLPVREVPDSWGRCRMDSGSAMVNGKLVYVWPTDGRSYIDPHVRTAQLQYAEFDFADTATARESMRLFTSSPSKKDDSEKVTLNQMRAVRWADGQGKPPLRLFRGDLHRHTDISADSMMDGDILDTYRYAMDAAALDFIAITDHSGHERMNYFRYDWWRNRQIATLFNSPGAFVTFFGYERTVAYPGGHRNIISTRRDFQNFRISDEEFHGGESYTERLFPDVKAKGDIAIPHTSATGGGTSWQGADSKAEPVVEIFQGLRGSYEERGTPIRGAGTTKNDGLVWSAWKRGYKLGVIASSDHQSTHQSYACVYAREFTAQSIHDGLKQRRSYAATDNIVVKLEAAVGGRVYKMGQEAPGTSAELRVEVAGTAPLSKVELIGDERILLTRAPNTVADKFSYRDAAAPASAYYYVRVTQANRQIAWSSPVWVSRVGQASGLPAGFKPAIRPGDYRLKR